MVNLIAYQRLISNTADVFLGVNMTQAAFNAANLLGSKPISINRYLDQVWPLIQKYDNDILPPFGDNPNPEYIWDQSTLDGQRVAFGVGTSGGRVVSSGTTQAFAVILVAFADNAMDAKIELFELVNNQYVKVAPQPVGLDELVLIAGNPNVPTTGLTEIEPYNWQSIRIYSTRFTVAAQDVDRIVKIVASFEVTNYLVANPPKPNPAGLQFILDVYNATD
ncbi:hypothetical protein PAALTS15_10144 [Paenibacillus alvei TS-15]|uniref:Uncharacterized protein n=1 Tax=Paenibacillus alvei TS-15 TaxID=1117108 RepID=S9SN33_PAEAL|nr:hypothetical protein [Paenibacillus alvei]EPY07147.1 hypothetical protein PAALTS15_10144 [Paenibacillus alvei TS-15]